LLISLRIPRVSTMGRCNLKVTLSLWLSLCLVWDLIRGSKISWHHFGIAEFEELQNVFWLCVY
jgi:hypothetical protein